MQKIICLLMDYAIQCELAGIGYVLSYGIVFFRFLFVYFRIRKMMLNLLTEDGKTSGQNTRILFLEISNRKRKG